jgi:hypothetical protein
MVRAHKLLLEKEKLELSNYYSQLGESEDGSHSQAGCTEYTEGSECSEGAPSSQAPSPSEMGGGPSLPEEDKAKLLRRFTSARAQPCTKARCELKRNGWFPSASLARGGFAVPKSRLGIDALSALYQTMRSVQVILDYRLRHESFLQPQEARALRTFWLEAGWTTSWKVLKEDSHYVRFHRNLHYLTRKLSLRAV